MNDSADNKKIDTLRDMILERADDEKKELSNTAGNEAEKWVEQETAKLQREINLILQDARKRSEDIHRRQVISAERDKAAEKFRLQNRLLSEAMGRLQDKLVRLRDRDDYAGILTGMCVEAADALKGCTSIKIRLAAIDAALAGKVTARLSALMPKVKFAFDPDPAPILGGCIVTTEDNSKQVNMDWQSLTEEMADDMAQRLLPLL